MGQQQSKQISVPGEASAANANGPAVESPAQRAAARAQSRIGNSAVQERLGASTNADQQAVGSEREAGGVTTAGTNPGGGTGSEAPPPRLSEHYKIEIKAWIPHDKVVDPEEPMRASDWLQTADDILDSVPGSGLIANPEYEFHSYYRGDNHAGYGGSYRVVSVIEFDWDGTAISNVTGAGDYGQSHRDWDARAWIETLFGDIPLGSWSDTETARATSATSRSGSGNSFSLSIASANPLVMTWAPDINADLTGTIAPDGGLTLSYSTDFFPSHGIRVSRNGKVVHTAITNDASGVNALGPAGAANLGARLMTQGNDGGEILPGGGTKGTAPTK